MTHEYDDILSYIEGDEWESIPEGDRILYWCFGSVAHPILTRQHRLVPSGKDVFRKLMLAMGAKAGLARAWPPSLDKQIEQGIELPLETVLSAWAEPQNQEDLIRTVPGLKYGSRRHLICDVSLSTTKLRHLVKTEVYEEAWSGRFGEWDFFDALEKLLDRYNWFYCPLPELTPCDLLVLSDKTASVVLSAIDTEIRTSQVHNADGRAYWPDSALWKEQSEGQGAGNEGTPNQAL